MRYIWSHVWAFAVQDFALRRYSLALCWISLLAAFNYAIGYEEDILAPLEGTWRGYAGYAAMYALAYVPVALLQPLPRRAWPWAALGLAVLVIDAGFQGYRTLAEAQPTAEGYVVVWVIAQQAQSLLTILLPLALAYTALRPMPGFYGLAAGPGVRLGPYLGLLGLMVPLVCLAAPTEGFQATYPIFDRSLDWPQHRGWIALFELAYAWDFLATELLFRGFFVVALGRLAGPAVVLPVVTLYGALHFGKPVAEAASSLLGGYVLSALALRTGNIWGGVVVHMGIALLMEAAALAFR